jgi:hypothetical protein
MNMEEREVWRGGVKEMVEEWDEERRGGRMMVRENERC